MSLNDRFQKALQKRARRGFSGYPIGTIAYYGPDDKFASKVAASVMLAEGAEPRVERWLREDADIRRDPSVFEAILGFFRSHGVKSVVVADRIIGCPHEEGIDYPEGEKCPQCPYWASRERWSGERLQ